MGIVVDLARWRGTRPVSDAGVDRIDPRMERLEMSIKRLDRLTSALLSGREPLEVSLETQLLALIGEISLGLLEDASRRAERLADRLAATAPSGTAVHGGTGRTQMSR